MTKSLILAAAASPALVLPGLGSHVVKPTPRAIVGAGIRADVSDPKAMAEALTKAVTEMRAEIDTVLKGKADVGDVVAIEKVERINDQIGTMTAAIEAMNIRMEALRAGGTKSDKTLGDLPPTTPEQLSAFKQYMRSGVDAMSPETVKAALNKAVDTEGGFLAPIEWDRSLIGKLKQINPIRANASQISISTAGFKKLYTDRAVGSGWVGETASRPATTTPNFASLDFPLGEIYCNPGITQQLLQDAAVDLESWLNGEIEYEFDRQEGIAFLSGDGTNKPYGILTYVTGAANATRHPWGAIPVVISGDATKFTGDGIIDLFYSLPTEFVNGAKFYTARSSLGAIRKLKDGQGNYLWQQNYAAGEPQTVGGYPIVEVPGMPTAAAGSISALFGNMAATYQIVDRIGLNVLRDPFTNKPFVHFYTTKRVGGGVFNPEPMRALKIAAS